MKKNLSLLILPAVLLLLLNLLSISSYSQTGIFSNDINGTNITSSPFTSGQVLDANLNSTGIARGSGLSSSGASNRYNASGWTTSSSLSSSDYFSLPISPDAGYHINFANFIYTGQRSSTGPSGFAFRHSGNGFSSNIGSPSSTGTTINLSAAAYQNITSATEFRLYGFNSGNSSGTFSINDFSFNGSVLGTSSVSLTGFSACQDVAGTAKSFTVNGSGLVPGNAVITVAPTANYEVSVTSATTGFLDAGSATFAANNGLVNQTVWVRLKANSTIGNYNGENINISGGGFSVANAINVSCSGSVAGNSTLGFTSAVGTEDQSLCINTAINNITYLVGGSGTGATVTGLPAGVNGTYNSGTKLFTITGSPSVSGTFSYSVTTTGPCNNTSLAGSITVTPASTLTLTSGAGSDIQAVCLGDAFSDITYDVGGTATGAGVTGLPAGLSGTLNAGVFTISGTSQVAGVFNYTVTTTGPCGNPSLTGTLTINTNSTLNFNSQMGTDGQTICISTAITNITYLVGGGGTGATVTGLPAGINGSYNPATKIYTISGSPTEAGIFNYTVTTTGPCLNTSLAGVITVTANSTIILSSGAGSDLQSVCNNAAIAEITYSIAGTGTGAFATGLPAGVTGSYNAGSFTIAGTPTTAGVFNYSVTTEGPCFNPSVSGIIIVNSLPAAVNITSANAFICVGNDQSLSASATLPALNFINENFSAASVFTAAGTASGNRSQAFGIETSGTNVNSIATFTNGTGNIMIATVGASSNFASASATTTLTSGPINTSGYILSNLTFKHSYKQGNSGSPFGKVEVSTNNGANWTTLKTYNTNQGGSTSFVTDNVDLSAYSDIVSLRIRFNYDADIANIFSNNTAWWAIDDVLLNGTPILLYAWSADTGSGINGLPVNAGNALASNSNISVNPILTTTYTLTASGKATGCSSVSTGTVNVNQNATIALASGTGSENQDVCVNTSLTEIVYNVGGSGNDASVTGLPAGLNGSYLSGLFTISGIPTEGGVFNYTVTTGGPCVNPSLSGTITVNTPPVTSEITGPLNACQYTGAGGVIATYSITSSDPLSTYSWSLPPGSASITGQGTNTISFRFPDGYVPGNIDVTVTGTCGDPVVKTLVLSSIEPAMPGEISGPVNACPYIGTGEEITYSTDQVDFANSYEWTVPATVTIVSGQGTPNLTVTINPGFDASSNPVTRLLRVHAVSGCGNSNDRLKYLLAQFPSTPGFISGPTNICDVIGTTNTVSYSINKVVAATSYAWTTQAGTTSVIHPNGPGINDTIILVSFDASFTTSPVTVAAVNGCGTSGSVRSLLIKRVASSKPGLISGPVNVCSNILPGGSDATYAVVPVENASSYTWNFPAGTQIHHPNGTGAGDYIVTALFPAGFSNGAISVSSANGCGTSSVRTLSLSSLDPATPGVLDVIQTQTCPNRVYSYTLASVPPNATSLLWTVPASQGAVIVNQTSTGITVSYPETAVLGTVTVQAVNNCGNSVIRTAEVKLPACQVEDGRFTKGINGQNLKAGTGSSYANETKMEVKVFPNPSAAGFNIQVLSQGTEMIKVRVMDIQGRTFRKLTLFPSQTVNLGTSLKPGVYILETTNCQETITTRIVKF